MKALILSFCMTLAAGSALAEDVTQTPLAAWTADPTQIFDAADIDPATLVWSVRPLVVFGAAPNDPQFLQQMELLARDPALLAERDVMVIADTDPANPSALRAQLRPRGFMLALIGKDGRVALRKPAPWDLRELSRSIDKMPLRQQEIRDRRGGE